MTKKGTYIWVAGATVLALLIAGCSTQATRVDCDGALKPINQPRRPSMAPAAIPTTPKEPRASDEK